MRASLRPAAAAVAVVAAVTLTACGGETDMTDEASSASSGGRLAALEARAARVQDVNDLKRLQRAYGYYVDQGMWDEAAALFAEEGTIEYGLDGVYVGRDRVRAYLRAFGGGQDGVMRGRLNTHIEIMPVVTLAPDGQTAQARWRQILMTGTYGEDAFWGEGPMENTYVKEDGVWRIQSMHWFQNLYVPYPDGWRETEDATKGVHVSDVLPPDRPPSVQYETWPGVYLPPFHFPNPVSAPPPDDGYSDVSIRAVTREEFARRVDTFAREVGLLEDQHEIENLQRIFGFYFDEGLWSEAAALFADDATVELGGRGVYEGADRVLAFFRSLGPEGPVDGRLYDHLQIQPVVHVAADGRTAKGRWRLFSQIAEHGEFARWGLGIYENDYVKEDGVWKIAGLHLYETMTTPYEDGWGVSALPLEGPSEEPPPDRPPSVDYAPYPAAFTPPFHYDDPLASGPADAAPPAPATGDLAETLDDLEHRVTLLEDAQAVERLDTIRAYYLARSQWDDSAALFAEDGHIEIAMRGVYVGRASVRRNLDLYTEPGVQQGLLHNHMQLQPVVHVSADGRTAAMRAHALSIMGQLGIYANWMGGVYENRYVKRHGVWRIMEDHQYNTYFASYEGGWRDLAQRSPPGVTESNPPDLPPSHPFVMYPKAFIAPFHYANPVTGEPYTGPERAE